MITKTYAYCKDTVQCKRVSPVGGHHIMTATLRPLLDTPTSILVRVSNTVYNDHWHNLSGKFVCSSESGAYISCLKTMLHRVKGYSKNWAPQRPCHFEV